MRLSYLPELERRATQRELRAGETAFQRPHLAMHLIDHGLPARALA